MTKKLENMKYGVPKYIDGLRNAEWDRRQRAAANPGIKKDYQRRWCAANREKQKAYSRTWKAKFKERDPEGFRIWIREQKRTWVRNNPEKAFRSARNSGLRKYTDMGPEKYLELLEKQQRKCAICGEPHVEAPRKRLYVDHKVPSFECAHNNHIPRPTSSPNSNYHLEHSIRA